MKLKGKISILASLIICLSFMLNDKADATSFIDLDNSSEVVLGNHDNYSFSVPETQCRVPRQSNVINPPRTVSQTKRNNSFHGFRHGFSISKSGKSMNSYTTSLFFVSLYRFPSGLAETSHHLIYLGKLLI